MNSEFLNAILVTLALLLFGGLAYGAFAGYKAYEFYQKTRDARAVKIDYTRVGCSIRTLSICEPVEKLWGKTPWGGQCAVAILDPETKTGTIRIKMKKNSFKFFSRSFYLTGTGEDAGGTAKLFSTPTEGVSTPREAISVRASDYRGEFFRVALHRQIEEQVQRCGTVYFSW